tara:strand:+ start:1056 stop:1277 length:222 start_codon:yes stop_codon:yes gene_type:complete
MPTNVIVRLKRGETGEKLIRRFIRKCKKDKVIEEYRFKTDHYIKPSVRKKMKREKAIREKQKLLRKRATKLFR